MPQQVLQKIMQLAQRANAKKFYQTQTRLLEIQGILRAIPADQYSDNATPILMAALAGFEAELNKNGATDKDLKLAATNTAFQLQKTVNLIKQLDQLYQNNRMSNEQRGIFDRLFNNYYTRIRNGEIQTLQIRDLINLNKNLAKMMRQVYPGAMPAPAPQRPAAPQPTTGIRGWANKLLDGLTGAFREMNQTDNPEQKQKSYLNAMIPFAGFFIHILGSFFKGIFGKGSEEKIDAFVEEGATALEGWIRSAHTQEDPDNDDPNGPNPPPPPATTTPTVPPVPRRTTVSHPHLFSTAATHAAHATRPQTHTDAISSMVGRGLETIASAITRPTHRNPRRK